MFTQIRKFSYQGVSGSQTFMSRDPLLRLTGEYLIYRDTWVMQYHGKAT